MSTTLMAHAVVCAPPVRLVFTLVNENNRGTKNVVHQGGVLGGVPGVPTLKKTLVLIILVIVFPHQIKIKKYMFVYIQPSK